MKTDWDKVKEDVFNSSPDDINPMKAKGEIEQTYRACNPVHLEKYSEKVFELLKCKICEALNESA